MRYFAIVLFLFSLCAPVWSDIRTPPPDYYNQAKTWLAEELYDIPEEDRIQSVQRLLKDAKSKIEQGEQYESVEEYPLAPGQMRRGKVFNSRLIYRVLLMNRWLDKRGVALPDDMASSERLSKLLIKDTDKGVELDFDAVAKKRGYRPPAYLKSSVATKENALKTKVREKRVAESAAKARALAAKADKVGEKSDKEIKKESSEAMSLQSKPAGEQGIDPNQGRPGYTEASSSSNRVGILIAGVLLFFGALLGLRRFLAAQ